MENQTVLQPEVMRNRQYQLSRFTAAGDDPIAEKFPPEAYCKAQLQWARACAADLRSPRTKDQSRWYPYSELRLIAIEEDGEESAGRVIHENHSYEGRDATQEPLAEELLTARNRGFEWFEQDAEFNRTFFITEPEAIEFGRNTHEADWTLYNLERYLEELEGRSIRCFLNHRSALSTNRLEELAGLGRGTLSKIKNGQRKLSPRQYPRLMRVLPHYGYLPHVDLRLIDPVELVMEEVEAEEKTDVGEQEG
jgi:hypothetical protein